jgi:hypothetical protein
MFVKVNIDDKSTLAFVRSKYIKVFPCGRRRSIPIDKDGNNNTPNDVYYIPFDPEARLNTEATNRKHSGLNSTVQSYIRDFTSKRFTFVINGYVFEIQLDDANNTVTKFCENLLGVLNDGTSSRSIYANIGTEDVEFFSKATTEVLRDQTNENPHTSSLDLYVPREPENNSNSYYFSGLSLTTSDTLPAFNDPSNKTVKDARVTSLKLFEKIEGSWQICNSSRLPDIQHGSVNNSIKVGTIEASSIKVGSSQNTVASMQVAKIDTDKYQLQFNTI